MPFTELVKIYIILINDVQRGKLSVYPKQASNVGQYQRTHVSSVGDWSPIVEFAGCLPEQAIICVY